VQIVEAKEAGAAGLIGVIAQVRGVGDEGSQVAVAMQCSGANTVSC
jgi:hypothetical protein